MVRRKSADRRRGPLPDLLAQLTPPLEVRIHERLNGAVEHALDVADLEVGSQVLYELVGLEYVGPDLVSPACLGLLAADLTDQDLKQVERLRDVGAGYGISRGISQSH